MSRRRALSLATATVLLLGLIVMAAPQALAVVTYTVDSTADDDDGTCLPAPGDCTLREAIAAANISAGLDKIQFALGAGVPTINVGSLLPQITERVQVSGNTGGADRVEISGPPGADGLVGLQVIGSAASQSLIRKLVVNGFGGGAGIFVGAADSVVITGNWLGTDETGLATAADPNAVGLQVSGSTTSVIGGTTAGTRNVISGNIANGLNISGGGTHRVLGNYIGTDRNGRNDLGNGFHGIQLSASGGNILGDEDGPNLIAGNGGDGIQLGAGSDMNRISENRIGSDVDGAALGNGGSGIRVATDSRQNRFNSNRIGFNGGLGIELEPSGPTPNDSTDADTGGNDLQNFPVITSARNVGTSFIVKGRLRSVPNTMYTIGFFRSPECDGSGFGEGHNTMGNTDVTTDAVGRATFTAEIIQFEVPVGWVITTTATDISGPSFGSTSEFSACHTVVD